MLLHVHFITTHVFRGLSQENFEFMPMLWGGHSDINDNIFPQLR